MIMKKCINCAWFCHADRKCYGNSFLSTGYEVGSVLINPADEGKCKNWTFDCLEEWERDEFEKKLMPGF